MSRRSPSPQLKLFSFNCFCSRLDLLHSPITCSHSNFYFGQMFERPEDSFFNATCCTTRPERLCSEIKHSFRYDYKTGPTALSDVHMCTIGEAFKNYLVDFFPLRECPLPQYHLIFLPKKEKKFGICGPPPPPPTVL